MSRTVYDPGKDKVARCGCLVSMSGRVTKACGMHAGDEDIPESEGWVLFKALVIVVVVVVFALLVFRFR